MNSIMKRRSVREFKDTKISESEIESLLKAGMQAPSAKNQQPWDFIVVDDRELLDKLSTMSAGSWPLETAQLAIIPMLRTSEKSPHMTVQDLSAATENILLEAVNLGFGGVWIGVFPLEERIEHVSEVFNIKGDTLPFAILALGHPLKQKEVTLRYDVSRIYRNEWTD